MKTDKELFFDSKSTVDSERIIYTPSDFAKTSLFYLQETGGLKAKAPHTSSRSNLSSYLFFIVEEGEGQLSYGDEVFSLKVGDCVFIDCKKPYSHTTGVALWKLRWAHFYGPNMSSVYEKYVSRGGKPVFKAKSPSDYIELLSELYAIADSQDYIRDMKIHEKLSGLLVMLMEQSVYTVEKSAFGKLPQLQQVKDYIDRNYTERITLDFLSERFYINKYYLLEIFKRHYGMGVNQYLIHMRITKSKGLLRFTAKTVEEIAYECGMNSPHYFCRIFKKVEGISPSEYRRSWVK